MAPFSKHNWRLIANLQGNYFNWFAREGIQAGLRILQIFMILRNYDAPEQTPTSAAPGHIRPLDVAS